MRRASAHCAGATTGSGSFRAARPASHRRRQSRPSSTPIKDLRARRFVAQDVKDLARYGLEQPRFELVLRRSRFGDKKDAKGKPVREQVSLRLRAGAACEGHAGESYVVIDDTGTVNCVADDDLKKLQKGLPELREDRLLPFDDDEIVGAELSARGVKVALRKQGEKWTYAKSGGGAALQGDARPEAVADLWKALRAQKLTRVLDEATQSVAGGPALRIELGDGKPAYEVRTQPVTGTDMIARRANEPFAVAFVASAAELLDPVASDTLLYKVENTLKKKVFIFRKTHHGPLTAKRDSFWVPYEVPVIIWPNTYQQVWAMCKAKNLKAVYGCDG